MGVERFWVQRKYHMRGKTLRIEWKIAVYAKVCYLNLGLYMRIQQQNIIHNTHSVKLADQMTLKAGLTYKRQDGKRTYCSMDLFIQLFYLLINHHKRCTANRLHPTEDLGIAYIKPFIGVYSPRATKREYKTRVYRCINNVLMAHISPYALYH